MNAGASETGRDFAARNCDVLFTSMISPEQAPSDLAPFRAMGEKYGRDVEAFTFSYVVCRPTRKEAEEYHEYYANEMADWEATENLMDSLGMYTHTFPSEIYGMLRSRFAGGHGAYPLVGTPDDVAEGLKQISDAGLAGTTVAFVNYVDEFPYFRDEVLPRIQEAGLREI
jgi:alkanesulfonate monooxygenase SsuD/methylene tetrahydromethanopterin reductase-like flavin-dependent oxidoreductase (luciferase family)